MTITLLRGLAGSGKSRHLIEAVTSARAEGRPACTIVSSDFPWPSQHGAFWVHRRLVSRDAGLTCKLDHFVSEEEARSILRSAEPRTLVAIEEAYAFGPEMAKDWVRASERGVDVLVAAPSGHQVYRLNGHHYEEQTFTMTCQRCREREATMITISPDGDEALSLCVRCFDELAAAGRAEIVTNLRDEHPFPGEDALYQPVELEECEGWRLARPDTAARAELMARTLAESGIEFGLDATPTYLDVGCNTGYFCDHFSRLGYRAKGIDATTRFIKVARLLDSFFRRPSRPTQEFVRYEQANAYEYLRDTQQERFDVTSAFAVFQWVMVQRSVEHGVQCIEWLASKTKRVCFLEMGYTNEELYKENIGVEIDREWVLAVLRERGGFERIEVVNAKTDGLQRDLFIGFK